MQGQEHIHFELLKQKIVEVMKQSYPGINPSIAEWKGQEITDLQEDLRTRVNANISEKWFYTYMKSEVSKLPRIDMLNLLSRYAGYTNWDDFVYRNRQKLPGIPADTAKPSIRPNSYFYLVPLITLVIVVLLFGFFKLFNTRDYRFVFIDSDTGDTIANANTEVILLPEGESPLHRKVGTDGSFRIRTDKSKIRMVVKAPYYWPDTIVRIVRKLGREEAVMLKPDDYALMIHYFSMMKVDDWEKRRKKLDAMIDDGATICQVFSDRSAAGMALYNKQEFIDRLTMPSGNLKNIEVIDSRMKSGKIMVLRFRINEELR